MITLYYHLEELLILVGLLSNYLPKLLSTQPRKRLMEDISA